MNELDQVRESIKAYFENTALDHSEPQPTGIELIVKNETHIEEPPVVKEPEEPEDTLEVLKKRKKPPTVKVEADE